MLRSGRGTRTRTLGKSDKALPVADKARRFLFGFTEQAAKHTLATMKPAGDQGLNKSKKDSNIGYPFSNGRGTRTRTLGTRFWRQCHIKRTVQIVPTAPPFVALGLLNLMPFDALLMLYEYLIKFDAQLPKNQHT